MPPKKKASAKATSTPSGNILMNLDTNFESFKQVFELINYGNAQILRFIKKFHSSFESSGMAAKDLLILSKFKNIANKMTSKGGVSDIVISEESLKKIASMFNYDLSTQSFLLVLFYSLSGSASGGNTKVTYARATKSMSLEAEGSGSLITGSRNLGHHIGFNIDNLGQLEAKEVFKSLEFKDMLKDTPYSSRISFRRIYNFYKIFLPHLSNMDYDTWVSQVMQVMDKDSKTGIDELSNEIEKSPARNELYFVLLLIISVHLTLSVMVKSYLHNTVMHFHSLIASNMEEIKKIEDDADVLKYVKGLFEKFSPEMSLKKYGLVTKNTEVFETIAELLDILETKTKFQDLISKSVSDKELSEMDAYISRLFLIYN